MGAAVGVEIAKPLDGSDVADDLQFAMNEVIRLRHALGHLAKGAGFSEVVYDASDLVLGEDKDVDRLRCVAEVVHIRAALRLSTAGNKRRVRAVTATDAPPVKSFFDMAGSDDDESSSSSSSNSGDAQAENSGDEDEGEHNKQPAPSSVAQGKSSVMPSPPSATQQLRNLSLSKETSPPPPVAAASPTRAAVQAQAERDRALGADNTQTQAGGGGSPKSSAGSTREASPRSP